jgi:Ca2+-binding EF-hand superfamily protein
MIPPHEIAQLQGWFFQVDTDRSGAIDLNELSRAQWPHGRPFDPSTLRRLMRVFDTDYSGTMSFFEFAALHKFVGTLQMAFQYCDRDRSWTLDPGELHMALSQAGLAVDPESMHSILVRYSRQGHVSFDNFVALSVQLAHFLTIFYKIALGLTTAILPWAFFINNPTALVE